jgi:hypothetical protein
MRVSEHEIVVDYKFVHDVEEFFMGPGDKRNGDPVEAGWVFDVTGRRLDGGDWSLLARGAGEIDLVVTAAIAVQTIIDNMPEGTAGIAEHRVQGSAAAFDEQFGGAFDLAVGAPEILPDMEEEHIWD